MKKEYYWPKKAYYAKSLPNNECDEIYFYIKSDKLDLCCEMKMGWIILNNDSVPFLHFFDDSWKALPHLSELFVTLSKYDDKNITEEFFVSLLELLGYKDITDRKGPKCNEEWEKIKQKRVELHCLEKEYRNKLKTPANKE